MTLQALGFNHMKQTRNPYRKKSLDECLLIGEGVAFKIEKRKMQ